MAIWSGVDKGRLLKSLWENTLAEREQDRTKGYNCSSAIKCKKPGLFQVVHILLCLEHEPLNFPFLDALYGNASLPSLIRSL